MESNAFRDLEWNAKVRHRFVDVLQAKLHVSTGPSCRVALPPSSKSSVLGVPKCIVEVWAKTIDECMEVELAYCRGVVCPRNSSAKVSWLGRSKQRPIHESVRGKRCVPRCGTAWGRGAIVDTWGNAGLEARPEKDLTMAEALLGLLTVIIDTFGLGTVGLQAMDNGSGRLVQFYLNLGFRKISDQEGGPHWMEAPTKVVTRLAPREWCRDLVPPAFAGECWMREVVDRLHFEMCVQRRLHHPSRWPVDWPAGGHVEVSLMRLGFSPNASFVAQALMIDSDGTELVHARCSLQPELGLLRVLWLGRSRSRPAHPSVRGCPAYYTQHGKRTAGVTTAAALLGVLAALGRWAGATTAEIQALDDGSGRLVQYLRRHDFVETPRPASEAAPGCPWMATSCEALSSRCCPLGWCRSAGLPSTEDQAVLPATSGGSNTTPSADRDEQSPTTAGDGPGTCANSLSLEAAEPRPSQGGSRASAAWDRKAKEGFTGDAPMRAILGVSMNEERQSRVSVPAAEETAISQQLLSRPQRFGPCGGGDPSRKEQAWPMPRQSEPPKVPGIAKAQRPRAPLPAGALILGLGQPAHHGDGTGCLDVLDVEALSQARTPTSLNGCDLVEPSAKPELDSTSTLIPPEGKIPRLFPSACHKMFSGQQYRKGSKSQRIQGGRDAGSEGLDQGHGSSTLARSASKLLSAGDKNYDFFAKLRTEVQRRRKPQCQPDPFLDLKDLVQKRTDALWD